VVSLTPRERAPVSTGKETGWTPEPVWMTSRGEKSCPYQDSTSDPSVIQPVASHYTDCPIRAPSRSRYLTESETARLVNVADLAKSNDRSECTNNYRGILLNVNFKIMSNISHKQLVLYL
jgi:hypothetical protein